MRLSMSKGLIRGDRSCWDRVMIICPCGDRLWDGEAMIIIRAREDCPCEIYLIYDSALRSSAQIRGDRPCRYMNFVSPPWVMNFQYIFEEYHVYTVERVQLIFLGISFHGVILDYIPWHPSFFMIIYFPVVGKYLIFNYLYSMNLILCIDDIVSAFLWRL